jgi:hypothetical protein
MKDQLSVPALRMSVTGNALPLFTTVLQSGIEIKTAHGETLGKFLSNFPGFTAKYLADTVQTIFLNGTAVDDLSLPLTGSNPVLALSAAMPGLAGAIFRKNSLHAALRTDTKTLSSESDQEKSISVTLKLFNSIARDRGADLLKTGLCLHSEQLANFLTSRPHLAPHIVHIQFAGKEIAYEELLAVLRTVPKINLNIVGTDG